VKSASFVLVRLSTLFFGYKTNGTEVCQSFWACSIIAESLEGITVEKPDSWREVAARCRKDLERFKPANERIRVFVGFEVKPALRAADISYAESSEEALEIAEDEDKLASKLGDGKMPSQNKPASRMSARERQLNSCQHLEELRIEDRFFVLPMMVKTVKIENIGPIREFSAEFSEGVNIVYGPNGCGKTVLVTALYDFFSSERGRLRYGLTHGENEGWISVLPYWPKAAFAYAEVRSVDGAVTPDAKRCALLDEPAYALAKDDFKQFLSYVKNRFAQAIITTHNKDRCNLSEAKLLNMRDRYGHES
jgi:hypothetical protein